eukprot:CAMPEP_0185599194 /NCGR_PEP_ID=MMETSP0434-20130131/82526_1 /TAXON_ID=626734 ORGANISM="Favella taraikaensis, Strain Fe Narragansett Bay" /NCGR_SAMPLE_ID=MMETSP0434 /ASSEMBLY_ACC=CAM_ASM_000379 /LENGTH=45 /DNA_ID= /DNA_START= /DNA_END= /DNA_ORIENTATION=
MASSLLSVPAGAGLFSGTGFSVVIVSSSATVLVDYERSSELLWAS